jgi:uncharacterized protein (UPF0264 family)
VTRLLVSVRSAAEALEALRGGAELIDVKEPDHGPLGAPTPQVVAEVAQVVEARVPLSVAEGELIEGPPPADTAARCRAPVRYAKLGLAGMARQAEWPARWMTWARGLPRGVAPVAVVYADADRAGSPAEAAIVDLAREAPAAAVLVDTWDKSAGPLGGHWTAARLGSFVAAVHGAGLLAVVGGSLDESTLAAAVRAGADVVAVRGAACHGGRGGQVAAQRVRTLRAAIEAAGQRVAGGTAPGGC